MGDVEKKRYSRAFISFINEDGTTKEGYFDNVLVDSTHVSFETSKNTLLLPWNRILKIKADKEGLE